MRGATGAGPLEARLRRVSIHAPRAGRDPRGALAFHRSPVSIHAPRAGRDLSCREVSAPALVSIHAPRAGRDDSLVIAPLNTPPVSIHAPRAGRDSYTPDYGLWFDYVSIHAPRAGRDFTGFNLVRDASVSIHAPRAGRDMMANDKLVETMTVSIHAPRAGRDTVYCNTFSRRRKRGIFREPPAESQDFTCHRPYTQCNPLQGSTLPISRTSLTRSCVLHVRAQSIIVSSTSTEGFAPWCSMRCL